jgi:hypothetical protein
MSMKAGSVDFIRLEGFAAANAWRLMKTMQYEGLAETLISMIVEIWK